MDRIPLTDYENPKILLTFTLTGFPWCLVPLEQGSGMKAFQSTHRCLRILLAASANISTCFVFAVGKVITALENLLRRENSSFPGTMLRSALSNNIACRNGVERGCSPRESKDCLHESTESAWMEQDEGKESVV